MHTRIKVRQVMVKPDTVRRRRLRSEEGSALVLVMFIILLLTILGMGVLSATVGGAVRTETRENDVQSLHLAQKGLDEATAYIKSQLAPMTDINPDKLADILNNLEKTNLNVATELGTGSSGKIESIDYKDSLIDYQSQTIQYYIDVRASALVNGVQRILQQRITIDSYPDFLKYAFGSEHNVIINGAPLIKGNIYAGNELIISNLAEYTYLGSRWNHQTLYPVIQPYSPKTNDPDIQDDTEPLDESNSGEVFVQSLDHIKYSEDGINKGSLADSGANKENTAQKILGISVDKIKIKDHNKFVSINVVDSFADKLAEASSQRGVDGIKSVLTSSELSAAMMSWASGKINSLPLEQSPVEPVQREDEEDGDFQIRYAEYETALEIHRNTFIGLDNSNIVNGNLSIDGLNYKGIGFTAKAKGNPAQIAEEEVPAPSWLVINGNLNITNDNYDSISIMGNILVTGDVMIRGKVKFDSTMFVLGTTTVEDAVIDGIEEEGKPKKELVLISKGKIFINRINAFNNSASEMNAFFYTDDIADLYGVGSIFWLTGGFFSKGDLTINAVLGETKEPVNAAPGDRLTFTDQNQTLRQERFKVNYNHYIYTHQQSSLPRVSNVNISVGPLRLVPTTP
ncbi:hypothetical protein [Paenibacillus tengchongensis]|uniref:hypothetical protein n=1 Tax=Paenibacillus tengchongensis TaxID=2608684 RepID=UPI00124D8CA7|nr:hypothetical protein [Paenibacillus tengchongensis]